MNEQDHVIKTSVQELLDLSDVDMQLIDMKVMLALRLKEVRKSQNVTQEELAQRIESDQSRVAKIESAHETVSTDAILRSLLSLGVSREDIGAFIAG